MASTNTFTRVAIPTLQFGAPIYLLEISGITAAGDQTAFTFPTPFRAAPKVLSCSVSTATAALTTILYPCLAASALTSTAITPTVGGVVAGQTYTGSIMLQGELA